MRIGIITFWWSQDNYGQLLQAYALQKHLLDRGHSVFIIKYDPRSDYLISPRLFSRRVINALIPWKLIPYIFTKCRKKMKFASMSIKKREFDSFRREYLRFGDTLYRSVTELIENPPEADIYITGSDQVWNYFGDLHLSINSLKAFFLDFGPPTIKKVSYAASLGRTEFPANYYSIVAPLLNRFENISVRENSGIEICRRMTEKNINWVPDPTLLLRSTEWLDFSVKDKSNNISYCFVYLLGHQMKFSIKKVLAHLKPEYIRFVGSHHYHDSYIKEYPTIRQWIGLFSQAQNVVTNSFHGLIFSVIFHKPFIALPLYGKGVSAMNSRITSFLSRIGLQDRILWKNSEVEVYRIQKLSIDWEEVEKRLGPWIKEGWEFLSLS